MLRILRYSFFYRHPQTLSVSFVSLQNGHCQLRKVMHPGKNIDVKMSQMCCVYKEHNFAKFEKYFAVIYWVLHFV